MINLLPPSEKEELLGEKQWKLVLILGILGLAFLISFSLILFSIKNFIVGEVEAQKIIYKQRKEEFETPQNQALQENLKNFNFALSQLDSFYRKQTNLTGILEKISGILPAKTYLNNLSLTTKFDKKQIITIALSGFSPTRNILLELKENLEKEESFQEIYFPPTNWVEPTDINFSVNFEIR